jgi:hypothetical protein
LATSTPKGSVLGTIVVGLGSVVGVTVVVGILVPQA